MKPSIAVITLLLVAATCSYAVFAQNDTGRPVGIPAGQWIPLSDRAGIVISDYQPGDENKTSQSLIRTVPVQGLPPPGQSASVARESASKDTAALERQRSSEDRARGYVNGYLMVKRYGRWVRLSIVPAPELLGSLKP